MTTLAPIEAAWHALLTQLPTSGLAALRDALACDSAELVQGATVQPHPSGEGGYSPPTAACGVGYGVWKAWNLRTAREVDYEFELLMVRAQYAAGVENGCVEALEWFDTAPRAEAFALVLRVAVLVLGERERGAA